MGHVPPLLKSPLYIFPVPVVGGTTNKFVSILPDDCITHLRDDDVCSQSPYHEGVLEGALSCGQTS